MSCPCCGARNLMEIKLTLHGEPVVMRSCNRCETRSWDRDGERMDRTQVMELAGRR